MSLDGNIKPTLKRRARRIAVTGEKGGGGKTTTALHLAYEFSTQGKKVIVIDNDPQNGINNWNSYLPESERLTVVNIANDLREADLEIFDEVADIVIIDGAPGFDVDTRLIQAHELLGDLAIEDGLSPALKRMIQTRMTRIFGAGNSPFSKAGQIVKLVDFVILPMKPSNQDLVPVANFISKIIEPRIQAAGDVQYGVLFSQVAAGAVRTMSKVKNTIKHHNFKHFESMVSHRQSYVRGTWGLPVQLQTGRDKDIEAINEIKSIVSELEKVMEL